MKSLNWGKKEKNTNITFAHALNETQERYRQLVELSPDAIIVHTRGKLVYLNSAGINLFGAKRLQELYGKLFLNMIHPHDQAFVKARINKIDKEGSTTPLQHYRIKRLDGKISDVEATGTLVMYDGNPSNLVFMRDITKRKKTEKELIALNKKLKKEQIHRMFLSKRLIDLLEKDRRELAMELHDHIGQLLTRLKIDLEIISSELNVMNAPVQDMTRSAIKKTTQVMLELKKVSTRLLPSMIKNLGLVPSLRALFNDVKTQTGIDINFFMKNVPERFDWEKELVIYRIAQEAMTNIIKHSKAKEVYVNFIKHNQTLSFSIEDNGVGFQIDEQAPISPKRGPLGLHIMRERAYQLGGEFTIDSRIGSGTHLLVKMPLKIEMKSV